MKRTAFSLIELVFVLVILGIMAAVGASYTPQTRFKEASDALIDNIKYTKSLAQLDSRYFTMEDESVATSVSSTTQSQFWKAGMWQIMFHTTDGDHGYTIFADTARSATSTNFDGRPMVGDFIAKDPTTKACISSYSENNLPDECENNQASEAQLTQVYGVEIDSITYDNQNATCNRGNTTSRIYFDQMGLPYCGTVSINSTVSNSTLPERLKGPVTIKLTYRKASATICVTSGGVIYGSSDGVCSDDGASS